MTMQIIGSYFKVLILFIMLFSGACTKNKIVDTENKPDSYRNKAKNLSNLNIPVASVDSDKIKKIKSMAYGLRFSASLEREILKTIRPQLSLLMTQFEVISTILDQNSGIKKNFAAIDCKLYSIQQTENVLQIFQQCLKPKILLAEIDFIIPNQNKIRFFTKEWGSIVGPSVALTAKDRECLLILDATNDKVKRLSCENTNYVVDTEQVQELRLSEFVFDQAATEQVHVVGGFYKNLVEHRKLKLSIPFDGKIKIIEKELKVRDDFVEQQPLKNLNTEIKIEDNNAEKSQNNSQSKNQDKDQRKDEKTDQQKENPVESSKENLVEQESQNENDPEANQKGVENVGR